MVDIEELSISSPENDIIYLYSDSDPPTISMIGAITGSSSGLYFKWFSTNPKLEYFEEYFEADLNTGSGNHTYAIQDNWSWTTARIGTQWIQFICKDQVIETSTHQTNIETILPNVTKSGFQGGKQNIASDPAIDKLKIHVLGAVAGIGEPYYAPYWDIFRMSDPRRNPYITDRYVALDGGDPIVLFMGAECRIEPKLAQGQAIVWGTWQTESDDRDDISYKMEDITNSVVIYETGNKYGTPDGVLYYVGANQIETTLERAFIGLTYNQDDNVTWDYKLTVYKGATNISYSFQIKT